MPNAKAWSRRLNGLVLVILKLKEKVRARARQNVVTREEHHSPLTIY